MQLKVWSVEMRCGLMANVLKDKGNIGQINLRSKQVIMVALQLGVRKVIPARMGIGQLPGPLLARKHLRARVSVQQGATLDDLLPVLAALTFEGVVRITHRVLVEREELSEGLKREMSLCILFLVYNCGGQSLLGSLSLKDLLFDGSSRNKPVDEACV